MPRTSDRRPMVYSRIEPDELREYQRLADRLYDGNLSLLIRTALRELAARIRRDEQEGRAA